ASVPLWRNVMGAGGPRTCRSLPLVCVRDVEVPLGVDVVVVRGLQEGTVEHVPQEEARGLPRDAPGLRGVLVAAPRVEVPLDVVPPHDARRLPAAALDPVLRDQPGAPGADGRV